MCRKCKRQKRSNSIKNEWEQHDSNGNPILEYGCVEFPGIAQSLPKILPVYFPTISELTRQENFKMAVTSFCFYQTKFVLLCSFISFYFIIHIRLKFTGSAKCDQLGLVCSTTLTIPVYQKLVHEIELMCLM